MAATKSSVVLVASTSNAANATTSSSTLDLSTAYGAIITGSMVNGGTGPTVACSCYCEVTIDGTTFDLWQSATASATANASTPFAFELPAPALKMRVRFTGNTGQPVTVVARAQYLTGL